MEVALVHQLVSVDTAGLVEVDLEEVRRGFQTLRRTE